MRISVIDPVTVNREQSMGSAGPVQYTHSLLLGVADVVGAGLASPQHQVLLPDIYLLRG